MNKKINIAITAILSLLLTGCSGFTVKTDVDEKPGLDEINRAGIIVRMAKSSKIGLEEQSTNIGYWLNQYKNAENLKIIKDAGEALTYYSVIEDRFYQQSIKYREKGYFGLFWDDDYLKYKSMGVLNNYLKTNEEKLKNIINANALNGLIIYEIYNIVSLGMQFMDFDSVLAVVDKNLNIMYMDHQTDGYEISEQDFARVKKQMMDKISQRLVEGLQSIDILGEPIE